MENDDQKRLICISSNVGVINKLQGASGSPRVYATSEEVGKL